MLKYYSLSKLVQEGLDITPIANEILTTTISAKSTYPGYAEWFMKKHIPGVIDGTRDTIMAVHNNKIVGVANLKQSEHKLCTLYFEPKYRRQGLGIELVEKSCDILDTEKPLITMPSMYIPEFKKIIKRYNWQLTDCIDDCYVKDISELIFNGELTPANQKLSNEERLILTYRHTKDKNILKILRSPLSFFVLYFYAKRKKKEDKIYD